MATERQIEANRRNAARSTGPRTEGGKARSRINATTHGLAGASAEVEAAHHPAEFADRREQWAADHPPLGKEAGWALDRAVAASLRIERAEHAVEVACRADRERARLAWGQDRAVEAALTFDRLGREPLLASCRLQASAAGVALLIEAWLVLVAALEDNDDWSESDRSTALDLLGVPTNQRGGRTPVDAPDSTDRVAFRRALALEEVDRLESLHAAALATLDEMDRRIAIDGDSALLSKPAKLLLRYERDAWRRYRESKAELRSPSPPVVAQPPAAPPISTPPPTPTPPRERPAPAAPSPSPFAQERRSLLSQAAPLVQSVLDELAASGIDEDGWIDALDRRIELRKPTSAFVTERSQFEGEAGRASCPMEMAFVE